MEGTRGFFASPTGKVFTVILIIVLLFAGVYMVKSAVKGDTPDSARSSMYIDTATGKPFLHVNEVGETAPILAPSGGNTGVRAEPCYWTASGEIKKDPTWVLLNESVGKSGPTFCPDCGRLVVGRNPEPVPGGKPPPTQQEYAARRAAR